jgi:hypothetical protein
MKQRTGLVVLALVAALALSLFALAGSASAEDPDAVTPPYWGACHGGGFGMMGAGMMGLNQVTLKQVGDLVGLTPDQVLEQWKAGKSLLEIAQSKGVSEAKLIETILKPHKDMQQLMVKNGYLTQEQADSMFEGMQQRAKAWVETKGGDSGAQTWGRRGSNWGPGGMMGGFGGMMGRFAR